jgi:hypothetical protein
VPPAVPLLERLARAVGYAQLDLADAMIGPYRAQSPARDVWVGGIRLPLADGVRIDDALDRVEPAQAPALARELLAHADDPEPAVRACCALFAAHVDCAMATAVVLQHLSDQDPDPAVRAVARSVLARMTDRGERAG